MTRLVSTTTTVLPGNGWMCTIHWPDDTWRTDPVIAWQITLDTYDDGETVTHGFALDVDPDSGTISEVGVAGGGVVMYWHPVEEHDTPQWVVDRPAPPELPAQ